MAPQIMSSLVSLFSIRLVLSSPLTLKMSWLAEQVNTMTRLCAYQVSVLVMVGTALEALIFTTIGPDNLPVSASLAGEPCFELSQVRANGQDLCPLVR